MKGAINLLNEANYLWEETENSQDGKFDVHRYRLRDNDKNIIHEIVIHNETSPEEVSKMIDAGKRMR